MSVADWIGGAGVIVSLLTAWFAKRDASNAKLRAAQAAARAEEALALASSAALRLQTHLAGREERERAELDAPGICEKWGQRILRDRMSDLADNHSPGEFSFSVELPDLASRFALNLLLTRKEELSIIAIDPHPTEPCATICACTMRGVLRNRPPGA